MRKDELTDTYDRIHAHLPDRRYADVVVANDGACDFKGDDYDTIERGISALTSGRSWFEKVLVRGNYEIDDSLKIPDYTIFELQGKIKLKDGANVNMIENSDPTAGNSHIIIPDGILDGNRANQTTAVQGIYLKNVADVLIKDTIIKSPYRNAIRVESGNRVVVRGINAQDCGGHGLYFYNCNYSQMRNCTIDYTGIDGFAFSSCNRSVAQGITMRYVGRNMFSFDNAAHCVFDSIVCQKTTQPIFGYVGCNKVTISNVIIEESTREGLILYVETARTVRDISIKNCKFFNINSGAYTDTPVIKLECTHTGGAIKNIQIEGCHFDAPNATYCVEERLTAGSIDATMFCNNIVEAIGTAPTSFVGVKSFAADNILP